MPNHCANDLYIYGNLEIRDEFIEACTTTDNEESEEHISILHTQYPCPKELQETTATILVDRDENPELWDKWVANKEKYGAKDWYDWCNKYWGTKWGDYGDFLEQHDEYRTQISFNSAWSPPVLGIMEVSKKWPDLEFSIEYFEAGMGYAGGDKIINGEHTALWYTEEYQGNRGG